MNCTVPTGGRVARYAAQRALAQGRVGGAASTDIHALLVCQHRPRAPDRQPEQERNPSCSSPPAPLAPASTRPSQSGDHDAAPVRCAVARHCAGADPARGAGCGAPPACFEVGQLRAMSWRAKQATRCHQSPPPAAAFLPLPSAAADSACVPCLQGFAAFAAVATQQLGWGRQSRSLAPPGTLLARHEGLCWAVGTSPVSLLPPLVASRAPTAAAARPVCTQTTPCCIPDAV